MHGPQPTTILAQAGRVGSGIPGICQVLSSEAPVGFFVDWYKVPRFGYEIPIMVLVEESSSTFLAELRFVVDTASDMTIISRELLREHPTAFEEAKSIANSSSMVPVVGNKRPGRIYQATLSIVSPKAEYPSIVFGTMDVFVFESTEPLAILGADALRNVIMVSDFDHVTFWCSHTLG